jgi:hypothetical protein
MFMIYEVRTYDLQPRSVPTFLERTGAKLMEGRQKYSQLGGYWYTEMGPLNQVIHIWPYEDMNKRAEVRAKTVADGVWPPSNSDITLNMNSEIYYPAPFMQPLGERKIGPIYEMRIYTYPGGAIPKVVEAWGKAIAERVKFSPLVAAMYSDVGNLNRWIHIWAYSSFEERSRVREATRASGVWPPPGGPTPLKQENKIMIPAAFSPMQ